MVTFILIALKCFLTHQIDTFENVLNVSLIVDACTFTPNAAREVCDSLEVMCGLAFT